MKTEKKISSALRVLLVTGLLLTTSFLRAQSCSIIINNNTNCDVQIDVDFLEPIPPCLSCSGSPVNVTIMPGSLSISCTGAWSCTSTNICDIQAQLTSQGGSGWIKYNTGPQSINLQGCGSGNETLEITVAGTIDINP